MRPAAAALALAAAAVAAAVAAAPLAAQTATPIRVFFITDVHASEARVEQLIAEIERARPDLVLDGGDFVHDATASEFRRARAALARFAVPWRLVRGNHDAILRGPHAAPPLDPAPLAGIDLGHVRFLLVDNPLGTIGEPLFAALERELEAHAERTIVVVMHVPPLIERTSPLARLRPFAPFHVQSPIMADPAQVDRFTALMERHGVLAVLAGHTHDPGYVRRGGVHYIVAGAAGGLTPGLGVPNEYLDITIDGRTLEVRRVQLGRPARDPVTLGIRTFRFYADLNRLNHRQQGWNYVPSVGVQLTASLRRTERGADEQLALFAVAGFERNLGGGASSLVSEAGLASGLQELALHLAAGYRLRPFGSWNLGPYVTGGVTGNGGRIGGDLTLGVGVQLVAGAAWRGLAVEVGYGRATNHRATSVGVGHRF